MTYFDDYIRIVDSADPGLGNAIKPSIEDFSKKHLDTFNYNEKIYGLLHGQVQSGKTAQALGIIAQAANKGFSIFLYMTTDNVTLQQQTLERARRFLPFFQVCDENEDSNFYANGTSKPIVVILKKNKKVLSNWFTNLSKSSFIQKSPLMVIDDEGDAASLNTKVNQSDQSEINKVLEKIFKLPPSGIYLQVTATPQSLLLQSKTSGWKPSIAYSFKPGNQYKGGKEFYGNDSSLQKVIEDNEVNTLLSSIVIPESLRKAFLMFLVSGIEIGMSGKPVSNMLVHPSHKKGDHEKARVKIQNLISEIQIDLLAQSPTLRDQVYYAWSDLQQTYPSISSFDEIWGRFGRILTNTRIMVLNSDKERSNDYFRGSNVLIGGNVLGRGLTIPGLQIVYYTRHSKTPLADTVLQHQRIFGYDRTLGLCRVFATKQLFKIFRDLTESSEALFDLVSKESIEKISIMLPNNINATRKNVLKLSDVPLIAGGVNYFPFDPSDKNTKKLDDKLGINKSDRIISLSEAIEILKMQEVQDNIDWNKDAFIASATALMSKKPAIKCLLIIRTERSIKKETGSLLSPDDRALGDSNPDKLVLTMYRLKGEIEKGWNGVPLWVPNIKLPNGNVFWKNIDG